MGAFFEKAPVSLLTLSVIYKLLLKNIPSDVQLHHSRDLNLPFLK
jgi:hypothetical protein